jgi:hypothetical protein
MPNIVHFLKALVGTSPPIVDVLLAMCFLGADAHALGPLSFGDAGLYGPQRVLPQASDMLFHVG